jgi:hypothetical protein
MHKHITVAMVCACIFFTQDHELFSEQPKASKVKTFEQQFGSKLISSSPNVSYRISPELCPAVKKYDFAQPMRFARPGKDLPPLVAEYYYAKSDSLVHCILYTVVTPNDPRFEQFGISIYEKIFSQMVFQLNKELGKPDVLDKEFKERENSEGIKSIQKEVIWTNKNMMVEGKLHKGNKRIRFIQRWKDD